MGEGVINVQKYLFFLLMSTAISWTSIIYMKHYFIIIVDILSPKYSLHLMKHYTMFKHTFSAIVGDGVTAGCEGSVLTHEPVQATATEGDRWHSGWILPFPAHLPGDPGGQRRQQLPAKCRPDACDRVRMYR